MSDTGRNQQAKAKCILKVDDDPDLLEILDTFLEDAGYRTVEALSGEEAVRKARESLPDLVLLDMLMPEMDGYAVIAALRGDTRTSHIPIMAVSARAGREHRRNALERGACDFLAKPFSEEQLLGAVRGVIGPARRVE
jgi:CheY-like chemotaxis protein